ncbi:mechanosensitive ion channel [Staphylococcus massiliensis]|uniref:Putative integral inner membrane protein n=1 Tax=Staphylococcus massiliensis S46 TaxID=1229783 RepID=K9B8M2_9STAP|nr:mechanosensitive ion channel [Staphylococcus massiliensis]EKU50125.1 putative integral inner membrane protein [Staphylococcus massiliensis S46]MCG3400454.1 mechanosensitive ion channel [Staphylococcus massiliensis]MCG3402172.1 mechanosensitive ion channel [Staphylococcus massiliensis]MCG3412862.1 mechanosensitive ion channel [Staphylococcus massiliensis]POA00182.1 hypothetical protein CD133_05000 [Staphylococcus massiliensis CCUG 55927]
MENIKDQFMGILKTIIDFIPNIISALVLLLVAWIVATIVKTIIVKGLKAIGLDKKLREKGLTDPDKKKDESKGLIKTLGKLAYFLVFLLFLPAVFDALEMKSVSKPINGMMGTIFDFLPKIIVAVVILAIGMFIAKVLGTLIKNLLNSINASKYNHYLNFGKNDRDGLDIPETAGWIVTALIGLFFVVQAINTVNLSVLNKIGTAIIGYLPLLLSGAIILALGFIGGNMLSKVVKKSTGNNMVGEAVKYIVVIVAVFMTLDQLDLAASIVNGAFLLILGAVAVAFAISFGIGGKEFAKRQLDKFENKANDDNFRK